MASLFTNHSTKPEKEPNPPTLTLLSSPKDALYLQRSSSPSSRSSSTSLLLDTSSPIIHPTATVVATAATEEPPYSPTHPTWPLPDPVSLADRDKSDRNRHWAEYKRQYALGYHSNRKEAPACPTPSLPSGFTYFRPPLHPREAERRFALYRYRILKTTLPRFAFDHLTNLTQRLFNADACIVSLVDDEYQWFVSEIGLGCSSTTRGVSFCGHAILAPALEKNKPMVVLDAKKDWRFHDNPLVVAPPFIQFYAGAPLIDPDSGLPLGTLCILGLNQPWEEFTAADGKLLCDLADLVVRELRLWREERWAEVKNNMQKTVAEFTERTVAARSAPDEKEGFNMAVKMIRETLGADLVALVRCADSEEAETTSPEDCLALDAGETPALPQFYQQLPRGLAGEDPEPWPIEFLNQVVESSDGVVWQDDFMSFCNPYVPSVLRNLRGTGACSGTAVPVYRVLGERQYTVGGGENSSLHHAKPFAVLGAWWADGRRIVEDMDRRFLQNFAIGLTALAQRGRVELANRSKSSFVNSISHELRTPLHGILAVVELLEDTRLSPAQKQFLQTIESCGRSLVSVVNHVLDLAKIEYGRMEVLGQPVPVDLWSLCQEVCDAMAATVKPGISFGMRVKTGCNIAARWCVSDPGCLRQILLNLIGNALKFTVEGSVVLELHDVSCDEDVPPTQRMIRFRVVDTGPGMSPRFQEKLCQPFSQENPLTGGTGLGLAITRYLVQAMRGDFLVQSQLGRGSAFQVTVPVNSLSPEEMSHISVEHPTLDVDEMRHIIRNKRAAVISSAHLALDVADCLVEHFGVTIDAVDAHTLEATLQHIPYDFLFVEDDLEALRLAVRSPVKYVMGMWDIIGFEAASTCLEEANGQGIDTSTRILLAKPIGLARFLEGIWQLITSQPQDILATSKRVLLPTPPPSLPSADKTTRDYADNSTQTPEIVFVPMFRDAMELKSEPVPQPKVVPFTPRVLVVEDNKVNRDILAAFLNRLKLYFVETCNGLEALEEYKRQRYDAILMDIQMPIMDGNTSTIEIRKVEVMRELECQQSNSIPPPRTKIWALTGLASKEDERLVRASGADGILTKPVSLKMLLGLFEQVWPGVSPPKKKK